jgi:hypothetical protein
MLANDTAVLMGLGSIGRTLAGIRKEVYVEFSQKQCEAIDYLLGLSFQERFDFVARVMYKALTDLGAESLEAEFGNKILEVKLKSKRGG